MKRSLLVLCAAAALFADGKGGIPPRVHGTDYPARQSSGDVTLAAALLTPAEAKQVFTADLDRAGYLVFEIAAYPVNGASIQISPHQFTLRTADDRTILPTSSPNALVDSMYHGRRPAPQTPGRVQVYNSATVGWDSASSGGSGNRRGGVYGSGDTAVGVGVPSTVGPRPAPPDPPVDRDTLQGELTARELPDVQASEPLAGYLYFAKPQSRPKNGVYRLTLMLSGLHGEQIELQVPAKPAK